MEPLLHLARPHHLCDSAVSHPAADSAPAGVPAWRAPAPPAAECLWLAAGQLPWPDLPYIHNPLQLAADPHTRLQKLKGCARERGPKGAGGGEGGGRGRR